MAVMAALGRFPVYADRPSAPPGPYRVQMLYRIGKSTAPFDVRIVASSNNDHGMWFALELVRAKGRWIERGGAGFGGYAEMAPATLPTFYGRPDLGLLPSCPGAAGCDFPVPFDGSRAFRVNPAATSRYYVVSAYADVRVEASNTDWRVRDVPSPGIRRVIASNAEAEGVHALSGSVERFTSAVAAGGRYGSSVFAYVPCEHTGTGSATLTGRGAVTDQSGIPPQRLRCGTTASYEWEFAYTPLQTQWRLAGDVVGVGSGITRLFVFDYPKP